MTEPLSDEASGDATNRRRPRLGFAAGLVVGALAVSSVVLLATWALVSRDAVGLRLEVNRPQVVEVSPVQAGPQWFSVAPDGAGTLKCWSTGYAGEDDDQGMRPNGTVGFLRVAAPGTVGGVLIAHTADVYLSYDTAIYVDGKRYGLGMAQDTNEAIDAILSPDDESSDELLQDRQMTIRFHRDGKYLVADRIDVPLEAGKNPVPQYW